MIESFMMMNMYLHSSLLQAVFQDADIDQMHRQTALTTEGDLIHARHGSGNHPRVDQTSKRFAVSAMIPARLLGKQGLVTATFTGGKRASIYLKIQF